MTTIVFCRTTGGQSRSELHQPDESRIPRPRGKNQVCARGRRNSRPSRDQPAQFCRCRTLYLPPESATRTELRIIFKICLIYNRVLCEQMSVRDFCTDVLSIKKTFVLQNVIYSCNFYVYTQRQGD